MAEHFKLSEPSEQRHRVKAAFRWCVPILWGFGIAVCTGTVAIAVLVLERKGFLPSWVSGWISTDRETQRRQILPMLYGLFALWLIAQLTKRGVFGKFAGTAYNGILSKLKKYQFETDDEIHARYCAVRHVRTAMFFMAFFTLQVCLSWRDLNKPFLEHNLYDLLLRIIILVPMLSTLLNISKCAPERFILTIIAIRFVTGWVIEFSPSLVQPFASSVRQGNLMLWILAFLTSLTMLASSLSRPKSAFPTRNGRFT